MAISTTPRLGLKKYSKGSDPHPNRSEFNAMIDQLEKFTASWGQGVVSVRPTAGVGGRLYWDDGANRMYWDNGTSWREVTSVGGGGAGGAITPGKAGTEGTSERTARADHTHLLALATATTHGGMSASDKALLVAATDAAIFNAIAKRDASGRLKVGAPKELADAVTKGYADTLFGGAAPAVHSHPFTQITGVATPAQLPLATQSAAGALRAADKKLIDGANSNGAPSALVKADASGRYQSAAPSAGTDVTNKAYVDAGLADKANAAHTHSWADITTGKPVAFTPSAHTHAWADITNPPSAYPPSAHTHDGADIATGTVPPARLPLATSADPGVISAADRRRMDAATSAATPSAFVARDAFGRAQFANPSVAADAATKGYVDGLGASYAPVVHTHPWNQITDRPAWIGTGKPNYTAREIATDAANVQIDVDYVGSRASSAHARIDSMDGYKLNISTFTERVRASGDTTIICARNGAGAVTFGYDGTFYAPGIYNNNAAGGGSYRAVWANSNGLIGYNLSSEKYKDNITDYVVPMELLDTVTPKRWQYKADITEMGDNAPLMVNFVAEDLHDAGLTEYVSYDGKGTGRENVETINEQLIVNALWSFQQQAKRIADEQGATIAALLERVAALESAQ